MYVPTCLPSPNTNYTGFDVWVLGWGRTQEGGAMSDTLQLQEIEMANVEVKVCSKMMSDNTLPSSVPEGT